MEMVEVGQEMSAVDREMIDSGIGRNICRTDSHGKKFYIDNNSLQFIFYLITQTHQVTRRVEKQGNRKLYN